MKLKLNLKYLLPLWALSFAALSAQPDSYRDQMKSQLDCMAISIDTLYAPKEWKKQWCGWDLYLELERAKRKIDENPSLTLSEYHTIVRQFFNATQDYHVSVHFHRTEMATLPIYIRGARVGENEWRYFISYINRRELPQAKFPYQVGDEVISFGGQPIDAVVQKIQTVEQGENIEETDHQLAEIGLVTRLARLGMSVPKGKVALEIIPKGQSTVCTATLKWNYTEEKFLPPYKMPLSAAKREQRPEKSGQKFQFNKSFICTQAQKLAEANSVLAGRKSFVPDLGPKVWTSHASSSFYAYIYRSEKGEPIGYIRLPEYYFCTSHFIEFAELLSYMDRHTDALVFDEVNNPGGSVMFMYALLSVFAQTPMEIPKQRITLTQEDVGDAIQVVDHLEGIEDEHEILEGFGEYIFGYPVSYEFSRDFLRYNQNVLSQWAQGAVITDLLSIMGVEKVTQHPDFGYSGPVLILTSPLSFSAADFFPAIMQDNKRAVIFGARTAGAGGYVVGVQPPNRLGIKGFRLTGSICERADSNPIENLGVKPDIAYEITVDDLQNNYEPYKAAVNDALDRMLNDDFDS